MCALRTARLKRKLLCQSQLIHSTESSKYYARRQTAVARSLGLPAGRLTGHHTDAASKHSLCYFSSFSKQMVTRIDVHLQSGDVSIYWLWLLLDVSAVSVCVCSNANPLHYYVLRVPCKVERWRRLWSIFESRTAWADHITCRLSICILYGRKLRLGWLFV